MIVPSLAEFRSLAKSGKLVPVYRELFADQDTPVSAFRKVDDGSYAFLLESVEGGEKWGRFSLLGCRPSLVFTARGDRCEIREGNEVRAGTRHPLEELSELLREHQAIALPGLPRFCGGAVGFFSYDAVRWFERVPARTKDDLGMPDAVFLFGDVVSVFDNLAHTLKVVTHARAGSDPDAA
jgi:anthranilate synthase component 1